MEFESPSVTLSGCLMLSVAESDAKPDCGRREEVGHARFHARVYVPSMWSTRFPLMKCEFISHLSGSRSVAEGRTHSREFAL